MDTFFIEFDNFLKKNMRNKAFVLLILLLLYINDIQGQTPKYDIDPYKTLGIPKHATLKDIKTKYRRLAKRYHPDKPTGDQEKMQRINRAFDIIGDKKKKSEYDNYIRQAGMRGFFNPYMNGYESNGHKGIGIQLTTLNYHNLLYNTNVVINKYYNKPWLIFAYEDWNQHCKKAEPIFEETCNKLSEVINCAKFNINKESGLISEFGLKRIPHFIVFYYDKYKDKVYRNDVNWIVRRSRYQKGINEVKSVNIVNALSDVFPKSAKVINSINDFRKFMDFNKMFKDKYYTMNKGIIFSDGKNRQKPHILIQYLANMYQSMIYIQYMFSFLYLCIYYIILIYI